MQTVDTQDSRYFLLGLVSFGPRTCGLSNFPGEMLWIFFIFELNKIK